MRNSTDRWGFFPFISAVLFSVLGFFLLKRYSAAAYPTFYRYIAPFTGLGLGILSMIQGKTSYPRVHNLKTYLLGFLNLLFALLLFLPVITGSAGWPGFPALLLLVSLDMVLVTAVAPFFSYRKTNLITAAAAGINLLAVVLLFFGNLPLEGAAPGAFSWNSLYFYLPLLSFGPLFVLSFYPDRHHFYLGGILAGHGVILLSTWYAFFLFPVNGSGREGVVLFFFIYLFYSLLSVSFHTAARMEHRASYDPLLKIYNREYCQRILDERTAMTSVPPFSIVMIDIDYFKNVNDTYGHDAGDEILFQVAQTVQRSVIPDGTVCRYGGEELTVFFPRMGIDEAGVRAEELRKLTAKMRIRWREQDLGVTISCGVAERTCTREGLRDVLKLADRGLYRAKEDGRNCVRLARRPGS